MNLPKQTAKANGLSSNTSSLLHSIEALAKLFHYFQVFIGWENPTLKKKKKKHSKGLPLVAAMTASHQLIIFV